ncbi:hypothetical protein [Algoriphagus halophytocola]|uniref:Uncharacterized protein n=1 Tax=Algoriphagus halophytocola TaxID=2991499 RepID=A0ABY6MLJ7_9BACT|nr:hypothetical protein [Algoriphagus sp. TR-M5]UZD23257.1 hypothetical protein OM944_01945 [Algoriphagus sp. TR-M5]
MKTKVIFAFTVLLLAIAWQVEAQTINLPSPDFKKDMLGAFSPGDDLGITDKQKEELNEKNSGFLDSVVNIAGGDESDDQKIAKITGLAKDQNSVFEDILGKDTVKKYRKKIKKQMGPLRRKYKLARFII